MFRQHLQYLICPECRGDFNLSAQQANGDVVESGSLICQKCTRAYPIVKGIPHFVPSENYASGFGYEWTKHARTQYDSYTGVPISEKRFFEETKWPRDLKGQTILEVGGGSGRFTEQALKTGAMVVSLDYSHAVEANFASNGTNPNVLIVQGDLYKMPFREQSYDNLYCFGVLQHTPDPEKSFLTLPMFLKPGGRLAADVYKRASYLRGILSRLVPSKYWVRPFTRGKPAETLYPKTKAYIEAMWPLATFLGKIPKFGRWLNWRLVIADYRGMYDLPEEVFKEWAILDTFDMLSPAYDYPQTIETFKAWFEKAGLRDIEVHYGYNGIEGRATKP
ncbi:MAG: methyltransferase domain-containing protein [Verrucomicrobiota bacterium]